MCAVVGVFNHPNASILTYYALHALQHRGQEASGIVTVYQQDNKPRMGVHKGEGLVLDVFGNHDVFKKTLCGSVAIGHNRYSTTGLSTVANIQPFHFSYTGGLFALAHNGNLTNTRTLRNQLKGDGAIFQTTTDTELFMHLIARSKQPTQVEQIREAAQITKGAYSLVMLGNNTMYAVRDPHGFRPLCIGKLEHEQGTAYIVASETCALDILSAEYIRDVEPNEIVVFNNDTITNGTMQSFAIAETKPEPRHCIFEYVYFSRPDSMIFGHAVDKVRRKLGKNLAEESPLAGTEDDKAVVISVPDSGNTATLGYARVNEKSFPTRYEIGLIRSHYVGRTFIAYGQDQREFKVKTKFNVVRGVLEGNRVAVVDDSIVRGTTSKLLVGLIRMAKPREVHLRITSPPVMHPCIYGMDFPSRNELIAHHYRTEDEVAKVIGVDSVRYLSINGLMDAVPQDAATGYCTACFTGNYPVSPDVDVNEFKQVIEE
ncbi:MAG: amidophosphoribosyltransferase [Chlorobi bacterium]|nr:MAG: amidophosphoribosyltransferase [Bacteroidota bacterium]KXK34314.1 MAG: glutamine phosphoribosylpyrophosphate amidotransferase [Chlorobi bacterium OLB6]MBE2265759.1 amidophosphoribosyltransferase [Flavobacteriales bacterium]MBL1160139.1 amidophosphoribosyltransferase [Chlorobiota bacterium]MBW7854235.1 amidophosphoribosyltransferase [Candidatus Kapabacteria bacterium]MCC6330636.1 amidophosphoribosyltransferase [Ignavibacteria bacterium]